MRYRALPDVRGSACPYVTAGGHGDQEWSIQQGQADKPL